MEVTRRSLLVSATSVPALAAPQANDRIQVGVIGCGARSHELMRFLMLHPQAAITRVTDAYRGRIQRAVERTKAQAAGNWKEILADKSVDAVVIASPDHWHKTHVVEALRAGKHVYCEKPLTYRPEEGLEIIRAARETGKIVQVGSQGVSSEVQLKARELIQAGRLGRVTMIRAAYNRNTASGAWIYPIPPDASPQTVDWEMFLGGAPRRPYSAERFFRWRCYQDYSGGIATDLFVHLCTTIHYLMEARMPSRVLAMGQLWRWRESRDVPDTLNAVLEYPEGFTVNLSSTFNNQSASEASFQFLGTEGTLSLGDSLRFDPENVTEDNRWIVESWPSALEARYWADPKVRETEMPALARPALNSGTQVFRPSGLDSTYSHMGHWLAAIRSGKPHWEDALVGHRAAACAHMVNLSVKDGRLVRWDFNTESPQ
jgi:predicted dehydrogenase